MLNRFAAQRAFLDEHPGMVLDEHNGKAVPIALEDRSALAFSVEPYQSAIAEVRELYPLFWEEVGHKGFALEPDYTSYGMLADLGALHLVTARSNGSLVGFHLSIIHPHMHSKSSLTCYTDMFYLHPDYRRGMDGYKMLKYACESIGALGVKRILMGSRLLDLGPVMSRLGFTPAERIYEKALP